MSVPITLPRWLSRTQSMQLSPVDAVVAIALTLRIHGTAEAIRKTAMNLRFKVRKEHQPRWKELARMNDEEAIVCARALVQMVTDTMGILPGKRFEFIPHSVMQDPPRCHYKAMRLSGEPGARQWKCQNCSHTKPLELSK